MAKLEITQAFEITTCCTCGIQFAVAGDWLQARRDDHVGFNCPNGHSLKYLMESPMEKSERLRLAGEKASQATINEERHLRFVAERERDKAVKSKRKIEKRISKGVCPCCNRTFEDLARHMGSKHKDYALPSGSNQKKIEGSIQ